MRLNSQSTIETTDPVQEPREGPIFPLPVSSSSGNKQLCVAAPSQKTGERAVGQPDTWHSFRSLCFRNPGIPLQQALPAFANIQFSTSRHRLPCPALDVQCGHVTCFSQWNVSKSAGCRFQCLVPCCSDLGGCRSQERSYRTVEIPPSL